ncbi:protein kinase [Legionella sp. W05-934-2]|jgi:serine/threonine protein kinase|uniref:protein kinase domain-containing protein n=1 Tax=Legionella sp. W05-934-2 TaxID=1198649 RepID=UPI00346231B0
MKQLVLGVLIKISNRAYDSDAVSEITIQDRHFLNAAISSVAPNRHYSEIQYENETIYFSPPVFIRASKKYTGKHTILVEKEELGRGKFGVVTEYEKIYLEEKTQSKETGWVIKQVRLNDKEERAKFRQECEFTKRVYPDVFFDIEKGYLVMPNLGLELYENIIQDMNHKTLPYKSKAYAFHGFLKSLRWIHEQDIIHHDLKPQNTCYQVVDKLLRINIFDFGLSRFTGDDLNPIGTPAYCAPEKLSGNYYANEKSDVFSATLCMLAMFLGDGFERTQYEEIAVLDGMLFSAFDLLGVKKDSLSPSEFKEQAYLAIDKLDPENDLLARIVSKNDLKKIVDNYGEAYLKGELHHAMLHNLKNHFEKFHYVIAKYQADFFISLFEKGTAFNPSNRLSLDQLLYGSKLFFLNEKQVDFLRGVQDVKNLEESEKVHLKILISQANHSPAFEEILALYGGVNTTKLLTALEEVDCEGYLFKTIDDANQKMILAKLFENDLKRLNNNFDAKQYARGVIADYLNLAKNSKKFYSQLEIKAYNFHHDRGLDYEENELQRYWNEFIYESYQSCPNNDKLVFFRLLPRGQQEFIRANEIKKGKQDCIQLIPGFQSTVESPESAEALLLSQTENSLILFFDEASKAYYLSFLDAQENLQSFPIHVDSGKLSIGDTTFDSLEDIYNTLSQKQKNLSPLIESKEQPVTPKQSRFRFFDVSSKTPHDSGNESELPTTKKSP